MWQNFVAKNFRCFSSVLLSPLARINLIAGKNNTGKTALLEAIHIHSYPGNCTLPFQLHSRRGLTEVSPYDSELARWLFYDGHFEHGVELSSQNRQGVTRSLQVWILDAVAALQRFPQAGPMLKEPFFRARERRDQPPHHHEDRRKG